MCELELESAFSFQSDKWLMANNPELVPNGIERLEQAKQKAEARQRAESWLPKHLRFTRGWPHCMPSASEAYQLAEMRRTIDELYQWGDTTCLTATAVLDRYAALLAAKP